MTASAHVLVFRPLIGILRGRGDVEITAREYAQTLQLLRLHGLEADVGPPARGNDRDVGWQVDSEQIHGGCAPAGVFPVDGKYREPIAAVTDICVPRAEVAMNEG